MTFCQDCDQDMSGNDRADSCDCDWVLLNTELHPRNNSYFGNSDRCHDCGIENKHGNYHHLGCDMERCPKCKGQLISCGCFESEYSHSALEAVNSENHLRDCRPDGCTCEICSEAIADHADYLVDQAQEQGLMTGEDLRS